MAFQFGSGVAYVTPTGVTNPTPVSFGLLQKISIDSTRTLKELNGQYADPVAIGAGTRKWTGKATMARFSFTALNAMYFGGTLASAAAGGTVITTAIAEAATVPAVTTYVVTPANGSATLPFTADQGVVYAATGQPLARVATLTGKGQYTVTIASGVATYTFHSGDASAKILISYNYTASTGTYGTQAGQALVIPSPLIGTPITWSLNVCGLDPTNGSILTYQFYNCVSSKLSWSTGLEEFAQPEIDFSMFVNAAGNIGAFYPFDNF